MDRFFFINNELVNKEIYNLFRRKSVNNGRNCLVKRQVSHFLALNSKYHGGFLRENESEADQKLTGNEPSEKTWDKIKLLT